MDLTYIDPTGKTWKPSDYTGEKKMPETIRMTARVHQRTIASIVTSHGCSRPMLVGHGTRALETGDTMNILVHGDPTTSVRKRIEAELSDAVGMTVEIVTDGDFLGDGYHDVVRSGLPLWSDDVNAMP